MGTSKEVIEDVKFNEFLGYEIEAYNNRPEPGKGLRYRRTPYDGMKDTGIFNIEGIRSEFEKLANRVSRLPRAQKDTIVSLVFKVAQDVVNFRDKEAKEKEKQEMAIPKGKVKSKKTKKDIHEV
jgi:hypothetical protein